jgi:hypothetical protein
VGTVCCNWRRNLRKSLLGKVSGSLVAVPIFDSLGCTSLMNRFRNVSTGESLAVKQLYLVDGSDQEVESIRKEIKVMWKLDHRNIVRCYLTHPSSIDWFEVIKYLLLVLNWPDIWAPPRPSATSTFCWSMWRAGRWRTCSKAARSRSLSYSKLPLSESPASNSFSHSFIS